MTFTNKATAEDSKSVLLASIGTVLIDVFEPGVPGSPPRPNQESALALESVVAATTPTDERCPPPSSKSSGTASPTSPGIPVLGGGGLYALIGARVWLPASAMRAVIDRAAKRAPSAIYPTPQVSRTPSSNDAHGSGSGSGSPPLILRRGSDLPLATGSGVWTPPPERRGSEQSGGSAPRPPKWTAEPGRIHDVIGEDQDDFPPELAAAVRQFGPEMWAFNNAPGARLPRARIGYKGNQRTYQPLVKPQRRTGAELAQGPLAGAEYLHVAAPYAPSDLLLLLTDMEKEGARVPPAWKPKVVYEPPPASCHPGERVSLERVAQMVDVLSPNHEELLAFYGMSAKSETVWEDVERIMRQLLERGIGPHEGKGILVVRCGAKGAYVGTRGAPIRQVPAFWGRGSHRVKDVTGAGNAFLGGYVAGLSLSGGDPYEAALYATVSASFVVEQFGLPSLTPGSNMSVDEEDDGTSPGSGDSTPSEPPTTPRLAPVDLPKLCCAFHQDASDSSDSEPDGDLWNEDEPSQRLELLRVRVAGL